MKVKPTGVVLSRPRKSSLPCETLKHQTSFGRDTCSTPRAAPFKSGRSQHGKCPPPVPPRKSIPEMVKEIKQVEQEIEQLKTEVSECMS